MSEESVKETEKNKFGNLPGPGPGRPEGSKNKFTSIKQDFLNAYNDERIEGLEGLVKWVLESKRNRAMFYQWLTRLLPSAVEGDIKGDIKIIIEKVTIDKPLDE